MDTQARPIYRLSIRNTFQTYRDIWIESERMENIFHVNEKQKKTGEAILIPDKIDLKMKNITSDKEGYCIMIKGSIQEEERAIVKLYRPNIGAPQCIRHTLADIKGKTDSNRIIVGDFSSPITAMDRSSKQKINKETQVLNDTLDEMDLIDIFRTFHSNAEEYTFSQVQIEHSPG